jgi:uncharacterized protein (TIGR02145 family)
MIRNFGFPTGFVSFLLIFRSKSTAMKTQLSFLVLLLTLCLIFLCHAIPVTAQVSISNDNSVPDPAAMLDVKSTQKGFLPPRMNHTELNAIVDPPDGLIVYCTDCGLNGFGSLSIHIAGAWYALNSNCLNPVSPSAGTHVPSQTQIIWNWNPVQNALGYKWNTINDDATAYDMGTNTTNTETGLTCDSACIRYVWSYSNCGTSGATTLNQTSSSCPWTCGQSITDARDGRIYNTVLAGTQCWMVQNLNVGLRIIGTQEQTNNSTIEKYCMGDLESNCDGYGGLYQWGEVMNYTSSSSSNPSGRQGICPDGWHLPSDVELCQMETWLDATVNCSGTSWRGTDAGGKMKETGYDHWTSPNTGATNASGFTALPGGYRNSNTVFYYFHTHAYFWTATESSASNAWHRYLTNLSAQISRFNTSKANGFSARCVKD